MKVKVSDWVCHKNCIGIKGIVNRVGKDGTWADVNWGTHKKRMKTEFLIVETTISIGGDWTVTDVTREQELKEVAE